MAVLEMLGGRYLQEEGEEREVVEVVMDEVEVEGDSGWIWDGSGMDLGWTVTGLVEGCSRCGCAPSPCVFI